MNRHDVDINAVLVKPLYMGLLINIFVPGILLLIAYLKSKPLDSQAGMVMSDMDTLFWVFLAVAVIDGGMAIFLKQRLFMSPMIRTRETFADDLTAGVLRASIICYSLTTSIAIYGFVYFVLGGQFDTFFVFVFLSFIAFQLIRPRHGFMKKVIEAQERYIDENQFTMR